MDEFQRKRFDNLLTQAADPKKHLIARELVARAFGWIDGLMEGNVIQPSEYSILFDQISVVESRIRDQSYRRLGLAS